MSTAPEKRPSGLISELVMTARKPSNLESWLAAPRATCSKIWDGGRMSAAKLSDSLALIPRLGPTKEKPVNNGDGQCESS